MKILVLNGSPKREHSDTMHITRAFLDGHAGSDRPFTSIEENAAEIISWIDAHCGGSVLLIGGLSLGGHRVM